MTTATDICTATDLPHRTFLHIKECHQCRGHWPMIASVLDTMDNEAVRTVTIEDIIERGGA
jgi:hypothetical protein